MQTKTLEINDLVVLKNDRNKCIYKIKRIDVENGKTYCLLHGRFHRIVRFELIDNVDLASEKLINDELLKEKQTLYSILNKDTRKTKQKYLLGKILHIDGDEDYLSKCLDLYREVGVYAYGECVDEKNMPLKIKNLLDIVFPDIVVITGHDLYNSNGIKELSNYTNTKYFADTVREIRRVRNDSCVVIAGACQSNYEALIASGADYASSPKRINIHTFDPAVIAINVATTSFTKLVNNEEVLKYIENGREAFGGVQTLGKMRLML